jgi:hypothetical protein
VNQLNESCGLLKEPATPRHRSTANWSFLSFCALLLAPHDSSLSQVRHAVAVTPARRDSQSPGREPGTAIEESAVCSALDNPVLLAW